MTLDSTVAVNLSPGNRVWAFIAYFPTTPRPRELPDLARGPFRLLGRVVNNLHLPAVHSLTSIRTPIPGLLIGVGYAGLRQAAFALAHLHVENLAFLKLLRPLPAKGDQA